MSALPNTRSRQKRSPDRHGVRPRDAELTGEFAILACLPVPVVVFNRSRIVLFANKEAERHFGAWSRGQTVKAFLSQSSATALCLEDAPAEQRILSQAGIQFEVYINDATPGCRCLTAMPVIAALKSPVDTDELTGLLRRNGLEAALSDTVSPPVSSRPPFAVHCVDLDRFKIVNDTLGHPVGDLLLKKVADRLRSACRHTDVIARVGGDEFIILQNTIQDRGDAETLANRIVDLVGRTYVINGHTINIGASVGIAVSAGEIAEILRNADLALYEAKRSGRGRYRFFETGMDTHLSERRELEVELRRALAFKQFELHYQPFFQVSDGARKIGGFEALIRWNHPLRGQVAPSNFIPLAEESGLINQIGEWVVRTACIEATRWPDQLTVAVNVSPVQFRADGLVPLITSALAHSGLAPERLELEITEAALLDNTQHVLATLHSLRSLGIKISMDDFGTGYSSLSYLQKFPFDKIKIDQSFIQDTKSGGESEAILRAIASLGKGLGISVTAEGVENEQQLSRATEENCSHIQGFLTGRPMSSHEIGNFLSSRGN